jgi:hypothetical protein
MNLKQVNRWLRTSFIASPGEVTDFAWFHFSIFQKSVKKKPLPNASGGHPEMLKMKSRQQDRSRSIFGAIPVTMAV